MTPVVLWQKSSFSQGEDAPNCLEVGVRQDLGTLLIRESDEPGTVLETTDAGLAALIRHLRMS